MSRLQALARHAVKRATDLAMTAVSALEDTLSDGSGRSLAHRPVFILGAPRSGTTLLYQCLVQSLDVGYLSNRHCRFVGSPAFVERLARRHRRGEGFESSYGRTRGDSGPSECGAYWYRFFPRTPQYVPMEAASPVKLRALRGSVRALGDAAGRPLVFKNLPCALRLAPLSQALPEALFVVIRRNLADVACSILQARVELLGDVERWWSVEPPQIDALRRLPVEAQAVEQARAIDRLIERDAQALGRRRFTWVEYPRLCEQPDAVVDEIRGFAEGHGMQLRRRCALLPPAFAARRSPRMNPDLAERVDAYLAGGRDAGDAQAADARADEGGA